jgi:hypothetical protein
LADLVDKVGSEESAQLSVWKLGVASCNFTTSVGEVGEVGEVGSFEGLGRETEEIAQFVDSLETGSLSLTLHTN